MKVNQLKAGVILSYVNQFASLVITIAYTPIMLRLLGQSEYGLYSLCTSFISYLGLLNFGLSSAYVRFEDAYYIALLLMLCIILPLSRDLGTTILRAKNETPKIFSSNFTIYKSNIRLLSVLEWNDFSCFSVNRKLIHVNQEMSWVQ